MTFQHLIRVCLARRWVVILCVLVVVVSTTVATLYWPKSYSATATIVADFRSSDPVIGLAVPAQLIPGFMATQADIIRSQNVAAKVVKSLGLDQSAVAKQQFADETEGHGSLVYWLADRLLKSLTVKPSRESAVISITYLGRDPRTAALIANGFAKEYIDTNLELRVEPARESAAWFGERAKVLRTDLEDARSRLSDYEARKGLTASEERIDAESARLEQLVAQLSQQQGQTYDALTRFRLAQDFTQRNLAPDSIPEILQNGLVHAIKTDLTRAEAKLKEHGSQIGTNHPQYKSDLAEVESLRQKLRDEMHSITNGIENNYRIAQQREEEVRAAVAVQKEKVLALKKQRDELSVLSREADNAQKAFDLARERQSQTELQSKSSQTNIAVLSPAVEPYRPAYPLVWLNVTLSCLVGLLIGSGAALAIEARDRRVRSIADLHNGSDYGVVVSLPRAALPRLPRARRSVDSRLGVQSAQRRTS